MTKKRKLFSYIIWKNFLYNKKEFALVVFCEILIIAFSFAGLASYHALSALHSEDYFLMEDGISTIFMSAAVPFVICGIVLIIAVMVTYLGKRAPDYVMFQRMGISKKDMNRMFIQEIIISYGISLVFGLLLGNMFFYLVKNILFRKSEGSIVFGKVSAGLYPMVCAVTLGVYVLGILLMWELEKDFRLAVATKESARKEKRKVSVPLVWIIFGCAVSAVSARMYSRPYHHESIWLLIGFLLGVHLAVKYAGAWFLARREKKRGYLRHLLVRSQFYYRFRTVFRYVFVFSMLASWAVFYFGMQFVAVQAAESLDSLFPYDFMCIADEEDTEVFDSLQREYELEFTEYPMVRVSNADKTEREERGIEKRIQGQQIGISESTYNILKRRTDPEYSERDLGLDKEGKKVYLVHQQDRSVKAQPIDWFYAKKRPNLHVGIPCLLYDWGNTANTYYERTVAGEEFGSLTGCFSQVKVENLVVFSDEYFETAKEEWKSVDAVTSLPAEMVEKMTDDDFEPVRIQGPTRLILFNAKEGDIDAIDRKLEELEERHQYVGNYDSQVRFHYSAKRQKRDCEVERMLKAVVNLFMILTFGVISSVFFLIKMRMEFKEKHERAVFLKKMGMPERQRKALYKRETLFFYWLPAIIMLLAVLVFMAATFRARMFEGDVIKDCICRESMVCGGYIVIEGIYVYFLSAAFSGKAERDYE